MAYTPINWQTGDTITAEKLNRCDNGWGVESSSQQLFTETVTTAVDPDYPEDGAWGAFSYSTLITADTLTVTFDGTDYVCPRIDVGNNSAYGGYSNGAPDFTDFPFAIFSSDMGSIGTDITTASAGTYAVSAYATSSSIEVSPSFQSAVNEASPIDASLLPFRCVPNVTTYADMRAAADAGKLLYFYTNAGDFHLVIRFSNEVSATAVTAYPEGKANIETYGFDSNMVFYVAIY